MICTLKSLKNIGLSLILMTGMSGLTVPAQAQPSRSAGDLFSAQRRLRAKGYYRGPINGRYSSRTRRALSNFQFDHNLAETGRLNPKTCSMLGVKCWK
jgi:peptidoglycan hydrolase-like protein with peptidoglycan-binding domain